MLSKLPTLPEKEVQRILGWPIDSNEPKFISIQVPLLVLFDQVGFFFICFCCKLVEVFGFLTIRSWERGGKLQSESCSVSFFQEPNRKTLSLVLKHYSRKQTKQKAFLLLPRVRTAVQAEGAFVQQKEGQLGCGHETPLWRHIHCTTGVGTFGAQSFPLQRHKSMRSYQIAVLVTNHMQTSSETEIETQTPVQLLTAGDTRS